MSQQQREQIKKAKRGAVARGLKFGSFRKLSALASLMWQEDLAKAGRKK